MLLDHVGRVLPITSGASAPTRRVLVQLGLLSLRTSRGRVFCNARFGVRPRMTALSALGREVAAAVLADLTGEGCVTPLVPDAPACPEPAEAAI